MCGLFSKNPVTILKWWILALMVFPVLMWLDGCFTFLYAPWMATDFDDRLCFTGFSAHYMVFSIMAGLMSFYYLSKIKRTSNMTSGV